MSPSLTEQTPYLGALGRTRTMMAQVWMPDGEIRAMSVYTGVDAAADPALAAVACAGGLHHFGHDVELSVPFTYHDPAERVFVLVVPEGLRHRALALRAEHMGLLASEVDQALPDYVRECEVVIGAKGLLARIEAGTPAVHGRSSPAHAAADDERWLALREREMALELRERLLSVREQGASVVGLSLPARAVLDSELQEVADDERLEFGETVLAENLDRDDLDDVEDVGDDEELEDVEDVEDAEEIAGDEEVNDLDESMGERRARGSYPGGAWLFDDRSSVMNSMSPRAMAGGVIPFPPRSFMQDPAVELCLLEKDDQVWLFVRNRPPEPRDREELDLLVQLDPAREVPVVLLSLVFDLSRDPEVRRGVVDMEEPEQARALAALAEAFEVQLVALEDGELSYWATLRGPREHNVSAVLACLAERPYAHEAWLAARDAVLAAPPPWRDDEHPFQLGRAEEHAVSATEAAVALDELVEWLAPERRARLTLLLSVPAELIDAHYGVGICDALDWGLALPPALRTVASELAIASDESTLLARRIAGLCRTSRAPEYGGLEAGVLRALWSEAVDRALVLGVELSPEAEELLRAHVGDRALAHAEGLAEATSASLAPLRDALDAVLLDVSKLGELATRGGYRDLLELGALSARLSPEQAAQLFVRMVARKDSAASDALCGLLVNAQDSQVRACAALSLAAMRAVDAIDELSRCLKTAPASDWPLFALCLGRYGVGSFRAIQRALEAEGVDEERVAHVHAHLALHGARAQIRARARSLDPREARIAERAIALAGEMKDATTPVLGLEKQGALTVFCELFDRSLRAQGA